MLYFEESRFTCAEIAPGILRASSSYEDEKLQKSLSLMRKLLVNAGAKNIDNVMKHIVDFDKSDRINLVGNVSKDVYDAILETRGFDLYGRQRTKTVVNQQKEFRKEEGVDLEEEPCIFLTLSSSSSVSSVIAPTEKHDKHPKKLALMTPKWKIGEAEEYNAPVGFAKNPTREYHSLGNEVYYSYDGGWKRGKMDGLGTYMYSDGLRYDGTFKENRPDGVGSAQYKGSKHFYKGDWTKGKYSGHGKMRCVGGAEYIGKFINGRRDGEGRIDYGLGLCYDGELSDGQPNGRGIMSSKLTGYSFDGTFVRGKACGSGVLITPRPGSIRVVRMWGRDEDNLHRQGGSDDITDDGFLLPGIVQLYLAEIEHAKEVERKRKEVTFGPLQSLQISDYVTKCRSELHLDRARSKKDFIQGKVKRQSDLRQEIKDTRKAAVEQFYRDEMGKENALGRPFKGGIMSNKISASKDGHEDADDDDSSSSGSDYVGGSQSQSQESLPYKP